MSCIRDDIRVPVIEKEKITLGKEAKNEKTGIYERAEGKPLS